MPGHHTALIARKLNDKNADMDYHVVPPTDYKAGGDSKREELCEQDPEQFTITATGASSFPGRLEATGAASSSGRPKGERDPSNAGDGKVYTQTNTGGEQHIRKFDDPAKKLQALEPGGTSILHDGVAQHLCKIWERPHRPS